jgi:hypothetical protein
MADEAHVIRRIDWKNTFPFTQIFKSFRIAIHPSKLVLALLALLAIYIGGKILDEIWPASERALVGEIDLYARDSDAGASPRSFQEARDATVIANREAFKGYLAAANMPNGDLGDYKDKVILADRDRDVKAAEDLYNGSSKNEDAQQVRAASIRSAYDRATKRWEEVSRLARNRGPFMEFLEYEIGQFYGVVDGVTAWNWLGPQGVLRSVGNFFAVGPSWAIRFHPVYFILFGVWFLIVWSVFGGAISRIAAVHFARDEKISIRQALRFSSNKFLSYVSAPIIPLVIVLFVGLVVAVGGLVTNIPFLGPIVVGALFFLALAAGVVMTLVLLGLVGGCNLMYPTIAAEGSDSFDAISRSFSYLYARPWRLAFYTAVAVAYGALTYLFIKFFITVALALVHYFGGLLVFNSAPNTVNVWQMLWTGPTPGGRLVYDIDFLTLNGGQSIGAFLIAIWVYLTISILGAYAISFYFSANTVIYFLMRNEVDATELDDVYLETGDDDFAETPPTEATAAPVSDPSPPAADEPESSEEKSEDSSAP